MSEIGQRVTISELPAVTLRIEVLLVWLFNLIGEWWVALPFFFYFSIVTLKHSFEFLKVESLKAR